MKTNLILYSLLLCAGLFGADATQIVSAVLEKIAPRAYTADLEFVNHRTDGTTSRYVMGLQSLELTSAFLEFLDPAREKGRQVLNNDGEIWSYLPDSRKVIRLADRDSLANGDFNNADVLRLNWLKDYTPVLAKESEKQYVIDLNAKTKSATYFKIRLWVSKADLQPLQQMHYDEGGHHMKTLKYTQVTAFPTVTRPSVMIMENVQTGQRTVLTMKSFAIVHHVNPSRFRPENLGK